MTRPEASDGFGADIRCEGAQAGSLMRGLPLNPGGTT
jgi:hypothetical protein